jgi:hypothetical protein
MYVSSGCVKWYTDGAKVTTHGVTNEVILYYYFIIIYVYMQVPV